MIKTLLKNIITAISLIVMMNRLVLAQSFIDFSKSNVGTTASAFLGIGIGARSVAMGGAYVAQSDDISALYWNPAGIAQQTKPQVTFSNTQWLVGTTIKWLGASVPLNNIGTVGLSVTSLDYGTMDVTDIGNEDGKGETFTASDLAIQLSWARNLTNKFALGLSVKYISNTIWTTSATGLALDAGFLFDTGLLPNGLRLGMSMTNFGSKMKLSGDALKRNYVQSSSEGGVNNNIPVEFKTDEYDIPLTFRVGLAYDLLKSPFNKLTVSVDATKPNDNSEYVNLGGEYSWKNTFFIRGGYNAIFESESEKGLTLGAGLRYPIGYFTFKFDYAYQTYGRLNSPQWLAVGIEF